MTVVRYGENSKSISRSLLPQVLCQMSIYFATKFLKKLKHQRIVSQEHSEKKLKNQTQKANEFKPEL